MHAQGVDQEDIVAGTNGKTYSTVKCYNCQKFGHYSSHCPKYQQQHVNVEDSNGGDKNKTETAGVTQLQLNELDLSSDSDSESEDSYCFDFNMHQFEALNEGRRSLKTCSLIRGRLSRVSTTPIFSLTLREVTTLLEVYPTEVRC